MDIMTVTVVKNRPEEAPEGWLVFNAPRPIYGHREWVGDFITGVFFTAVDPDASEADHFVERNRQLDARQIDYITREEWDRRVDAYGQKMAKEHDIDLADFDRRDIEFSYQGWIRSQNQDTRF